MVAVDSEGRPNSVPPLPLDTPMAKLRFEKAELRKKMRKQAEEEEKRAQASLSPTSQAT